MNGLKPYFAQNFLTRQELKTVCAVAFLLLVEWGVKNLALSTKRKRRPTGLKTNATV